MEGAESPIFVASELTLVDLDEDHMITEAAISIGEPQESDEISLDTSLVPSLEVVYQEIGRIVVRGNATDEQYQVCLQLTHQN